jgi:hypothetical protein
MQKKSNCFHVPPLKRVLHAPISRDTYLEQQHTVKIETEVRDVNRIQITKVYDSVRLLSRVAF